MRYGIPLSDWLDLSTGVNPQVYPVPPVPVEAWRRLPEEEDGLEHAARAYYGADFLLPVAGSQAAIQALPRLRPPCRVGVLVPAYAEHAHAWRQAGHEVIALEVGWNVRQRIPANGRACWDSLGSSQPTEEGFGTPFVAQRTMPTLPEGEGAKREEATARDHELDVLIVVNPNNPTGRLISPEVLLAWHERLAARGGWLVVDEAFMDATPDYSLAAHAGRPGLIVLRSVGKYFGLAGARAGFVLAEADLLDRMAALLGPWALAGPSRWAVQAALTDRTWQDAMRPRLTASSARLAELLGASGLPSAGGTALFQYCPTPEAVRFHDHLARQGIWVRRFDQPAALRFGLPGEASQWHRLVEALNNRA